MAAGANLDLFQLIIDKCDGSKTVEKICKEIYNGVLLNKFIEDSTIFLDKLNKEGFITWK